MMQGQVLGQLFEKKHTWSLNETQFMLPPREGLHDDSDSIAFRSCLLQWPGRRMAVSEIAPQTEQMQKAVLFHTFSRNLSGLGGGD